MSMVLARIALRYLAGALLAAGYLDTGLADTLSTDPDMLMLLGAAIGGATEGLYAVARRMGWAT